MPESLHLRISPSVNDNSVRSEFIRHEVLLHIAPFERQRGVLMSQISLEIEGFKLLFIWSF